MGVFTQSNVNIRMCRTNNRLNYPRPNWPSAASHHAQTLVPQGVARGPNSKGKCQGGIRSHLAGGLQRAHLRSPRNISPSSIACKPVIHKAQRGMAPADRGSSGRGRPSGAARSRSPRSRRRGTSRPRPTTTLALAQPLREYGTSGSIDHPCQRTASKAYVILPDT